MNHKNKLASQHAARQTHHLVHSLGGLPLLAIAYAAGLALQGSGLVTNLFPNTVLWCLPAYLLAAHLIYRSVHLPVVEQFSMLIINSLAPYPVLMLGFALLQHRYSRGAVLTAALITMTWFWLVEMRARKRQKLVLVHLDPEAPANLKNKLGARQAELMRHIELVFWPIGETSLPACNGALITDKPESPEQAHQLAQLKLHHIRLYSVAVLAESLTGKKAREALTDPLWQPDSNPAYDAVKRIADCTLVVLLAPFWVPLGLLVATAIRMDSPGPALFSQTRTGWHGKPFRIWKFRTMVQSKHQETQFAQKNDSRITRLGRFLRKSRLDEIPQLVNVLLGHMSLIGPRPEQHAFVEKFAIEIPSYPYRHLVRPGLTGWAQVMQGYAASTGETHVKLQYDLYYVSHYSIALDLLITAKTVKTILTGFGAR